MHAQSIRETPAARLSAQAFTSRSSWLSAGWAGITDTLGSRTWTNATHND